MSTGYLVDTSVVSWYLEREARTRHPTLVSWLDDLIPREGLCISAVTLYDLRRGVEGLLREGQGARKAARVENLLRETTILGLDERGFAGWRLAADLWANCKHHQPSVVLSEGDLLIAATALMHDRQLVTVDVNLQARLKAIGHEGLLHLLAP
ncbi:MAG TPA: type II toxin-antitoxin system VapC family toxin [Polyangia bacterium]|jgi:Predicted nucleic acid-binding protein, contains PIN domain|nr:type II toxin-antitoxin system VapC family toxin [Polyangia bacterium]